MGYRKKISLLLLIIYLLTNNLWVVPFVEYYYNLDEIIKNYCVERDLEENLCMGSCYLNNQVKEAVKKQKYGEYNSEKPDVKPVLVSYHLSGKSVDIPNCSISNSIKYTNINASLITYSDEIPSPPPRF